MQIKYSHLQKIFFTTRTYRFLLTGVLNTGVDFLVFNLLLFLLVYIQFDTRLFFAKAIGFIVASVCSYFVNSRWTFGLKIVSIQKYIIFLIVSSIGLLVNLLTTYVVFSRIQIMLPSPVLLSVYVAFLSATFASLLWNYFGYKRFVFSL